MKTVIDHDLKELDEWSNNGWCLLTRIKHKLCYFQIRKFQN
jgi:hypothetical protein